MRLVLVDDIRKYYGRGEFVLRRNWLEPFTILATGGLVDNFSYSIYFINYSVEIQWCLSFTTLDGNPN